MSEMRLLIGVVLPVDDEAALFENLTGVNFAR